MNSPPVSSDWGKTGRLARQNAPAGFLWLASAAQLRNELQRHRVGLSDGRAVPGPARLGWVSWASRWVRAAAVHRNKEGRSSKLRPSYVRPRRGLGGMGLAGRCLTFPQFAAVGPVLRPYGSGPWHQNKSPATSAPGGWRRGPPAPPTVPGNSWGYSIHYTSAPDPERKNPLAKCPISSVVDFPRRGFLSWAAVCSRRRAGLLRCGRVILAIPLPRAATYRSAAYRSSRSAAASPII